MNTNTHEDEDEHKVRRTDRTQTTRHNTTHEHTIDHTIDHTNTTTPPPRTNERTNERTKLINQESRIRESLKH